MEIEHLLCISEFLGSIPGIKSPKMEGKYGVSFNFIYGRLKDLY